jgi:hypothetical protein
VTALLEVKEFGKNKEFRGPWLTYAVFTWTLVLKNLCFCHIGLPKPFQITHVGFTKFVELESRPTCVIWPVIVAS